MENLLHAAAEKLNFKLITKITKAGNYQAKVLIPTDEIIERIKASNITITNLEKLNESIVYHNKFIEFNVYKRGAIRIVNNTASLGYDGGQKGKDDITFDINVVESLDFAVAKMKSLYILHLFRVIFTDFIYTDTVDLDVTCITPTRIAVGNSMRIVSVQKLVLTEKKEQIISHSVVPVEAYIHYYTESMQKIILSFSTAVRNALSPHLLVIGEYCFLNNIEAMLYTDSVGKHSVLQNVFKIVDSEYIKTKFKVRPRFNISFYGSVQLDIKRNDFYPYCKISSEIFI